LLLFDAQKQPTVMIEKYQDLKPLTKREMKELRGGGTGSCGNVLTLKNGKRCVVDNISRPNAIDNSAQFNLGQGEYNAGGYGDNVTDVNWCCASCSNFDRCDHIDA
jgi:hypothetical protein